MQDSSLYTLIYTSRAVRPFPSEELDDLLEKARVHNQQEEISGMLVHLAGSFMQALEGPEEAVTRLFMDKITVDDRHGLIEVVTKGPIQERKFKEWSMAFNNLDEKEDKPEGFSEFLEKGFTDELATEHKALAPAILNSFKRKYGPLDDSWPPGG